MIDSEVHTDLKLLKASQISQSFAREDLNVQSQLHYDSVKLLVQKLVPGC